MKLSIIYVNHNTQDFLKKSLRSLVSYNLISDYEVIVVDNASTHFEASSLRKIFPSVKIVPLTHNIGFGQGNNAGAREASGEYLFFLNTDTELGSESHLEQIIKFLDTHPAYAAAAPLLLLPDKSLQYTQIQHFPSIIRSILEKPNRFFTNHLKFLHKLFQHFGVHYLPDYECDVDCVSAAAVVVRTDLFNKVGGFDKDYFMYFEDTDLWKKLHQAGYKIRFFPQSQVIHYESVSTKAGGRKAYYLKSRAVYYKKWKSKPRQIMLRLLHLLNKLKD